MILFSFVSNWYTFFHIFLIFLAFYVDVPRGTILDSQMGSHVSSQMVRFLYVIPMLSILLGCSGQIENPHLLDPAFNEANKEHELIKTLINTELKNIETAEKELKATELYSIDRKIKLIELSKAKDRLAKLEQKKEYFAIKTKMIKAHDKKAYLLTTQNGQKWPENLKNNDQSDYLRYKSTPKRWSVRVPGSPFYDKEKYGRSEPASQSSQSSQNGH
jgi:hypothetical protein